MALLQSAFITGISGFIGAALAHRLVAQGTRVAGLVRPGSDNARLRDLPEVELFELADPSVTDLTAIFRQTQPAVVFNLAAAGVVAPAPNLPTATPADLMTANVQLVLNLIQALATFGGSRLIHTGSCFEYAASDQPLTEKALLAPFSFYGATKSASVLLAQSLSQSLGLPQITLRLFGVYGPGEDSRRLIPTLVNQLHQYQAVELTAGTQIRDLLYVDDVCDAFCLAAEQFEVLQSHPVLNVCSGVGTSVRQVGQTLAEQMSRPHTLLQWGKKPARLQEPACIVGDNRLFQSLTGWQPNYSLATGLQQTINQLLAARALPQLSA